MYNPEIIFILLSLFVILGGGLIDTNYISISNICMNLVLLSPLLILKAKVHKTTNFLNKNYKLDELTYMLKNQGNLSDRDIRKYVRRIDIINDIDDDGIDIAVENLTQLAKDTNNQKEFLQILRRIDSKKIKNNLELF